MWDLPATRVLASTLVPRIEPRHQFSAFPRYPWLGEKEEDLSDFIESVDGMVARHFARQAIVISKLSNEPITEELLIQIIRSSIANARSQVEDLRGGR